MYLKLKINFIIIIKQIHLVNFLFSIVEMDLNIINYNIN